VNESGVKRSKVKLGDSTEFQCIEAGIYMYTQVYDTRHGA
jgi:hypothetical protein